MSPIVTDNNAKCFQATGPPAHSISQLAASLPSAAPNKNCQFKYFPREHAELSPGAGARGAGCDWRPAGHVTTMVASDWWRWRWRWRVVPSPRSQLFKLRVRAPLWIGARHATPPALQLSSRSLLTFQLGIKMGGVNV